MFESPDNIKNHPAEKERSFERPPIISETRFNELIEVGGFYTGVVEGAGKERYEDILRDVKAVYNTPSHEFSKIILESRAYGDMDSLKDRADISHYRLSISVESMEDHRTQGPHIINISMKDIGIAKVERFRALVQDLHKSLAYSLDIIPKSNEGIQGYVKFLIDERLRDYQDYEDIQEEQERENSRDGANDVDDLDKTDGDNLIVFPGPLR